MSIAVATRLDQVAGPRRTLAGFGPNWFGAVMGTGIVANAAATLPFEVPGLDVLARAMWLLATLLLVVMVAATAAHWRSHPEVARGHLDHPVMAHFYGAPAMALMTVGAGFLLIGEEVVGTHAAITLAVALWTIGTIFGLWTTWAVPRRTLRRGARYTGPAFGGWLMPVVPAMVSAATGALLVPHLPSALRPAMIGGCYALFTVALVTSLPILVIIVHRVTVRQIGPGTAPTLFIVLGPLGQSVTAAHALGDEAGGRFVTLGIAYGLPVMTLAMAWLVVAVAAAACAAREGLPFTLSWWAFTFPVGTLVTGASGLANATDARVLEGIAGVLFVALVGAWAAVAALTVRGVWNGGLLAPAQTA